MLRKRSINFDFGGFSTRVKPGLAWGGGWILLIVVLFLAHEVWMGWKHSVWDGSGYFAFAYESGGEVGYVGINKELEEVFVLKFPDDLMMPLAFGYGEYQVDKIEDLAELDKVEFGELLKNSMTQYLGVVADAYVVGDRNVDVNVNRLLVKSLFRIARTDLSSWDVIRLLIFVRNLRVEQIKVVDLRDSGVLFEKSLPDGSVVFMTDFETLDNLVLKQLADPVYLADASTWEIYNGTDNSGFAAKMKRLVANSGFDVVGVRQSDQMYEKTVLEVKEDDLTESIQSFADSLGVEVVFVSDESRRSNVRLVLGEDYWRRCCTRRLGN
jgi:hypothetical protein